MSARFMLRRRSHPGRLAKIALSAHVSISKKRLTEKARTPRNEAFNTSLKGITENAKKVYGDEELEQ